MGGSGSNELEPRRSPTALKTADAGSDLIARQEKRRRTFKEKYGGEFGEIAISYAIRGRMGVPSQTFFMGRDISTDHVRSFFSNALIREIDKQPIETRPEWLGGFLEDLDIAVPR